MLNFFYKNLKLYFFCSNVQIQYGTLKLSIKLEYMNFWNTHSSVSNSNYYNFFFFISTVNILQVLYLQNSRNKMFQRLSCPSETHNSLMNYLQTLNNDLYNLMSIKNMYTCTHFYNIIFLMKHFKIIFSFINCGLGKKS